jgi:hypothetical protein
VDTPGDAFGIAVLGDLAYMACGQVGLQLVDISDPALPQLLGIVDTPGTAQHVDARGGYAYVADGSEGLQIIDVNDPNSPVIIGNFATPGYAYDIVTIGNVAYIADNTGIHVLDITMPDMPVVIGGAYLLGSVNGIAASQDAIIVAEYNKVILIPRECGDAISSLPTAPRMALMLGQNVPNPFNPQTTIAFDLPNQSAVRLAVYDVSGRLVDVLLDGDIAVQGRSEVVWQGRDMGGRVVSAGVYFYRLEAGSFSETKRMVLVK